MKLWVGEEKEGEFKGLKTLFVGSPDITLKQIKKYADEYNVKQIYFGAGDCTPINAEVVKDCIVELYDIILTAEIKIEELAKMDSGFLDGVNLIVTIENEYLDSLTVIPPHMAQIKLLSKDREELFVAKFEDFVETDMSENKGKIYEGDEVIL